jgi:hypothetical protein
VAHCWLGCFLHMPIEIWNFNSGLVWHIHLLISSQQTVELGTYGIFIYSDAAKIENTLFRILPTEDDLLGTRAGEHVVGAPTKATNGTATIKIYSIQHAVNQKVQFEPMNNSCEIKILREQLVGLDEYRSSLRLTSAS